MESIWIWLIGILGTLITLGGSAFLGLLLKRISELSDNIRADYAKIDGKIDVHIAESREVREWVAMGKQRWKGHEEIHRLHEEDMDRRLDRLEEKDR